MLSVRKKLQLSAVMTQSNKTIYYISQRSDGSRITNQGLNLQRHTKPRPNGRLMVCRLWEFRRKLIALKRHRTVVRHFDNSNTYWHCGTYILWWGGYFNPKAHMETSENVVLGVTPDGKVHGAYMGPTLGRQDQGWPHVVPMNLAIRDTTFSPERSR